MFWLQPEDLCPCRFCRRLVPSCRPCPRVSSRRFWHTVYSAQARCDPTARRLLVKDALRGASATRPRSATPLGRVGLDGSPPPVRSAGSRACWSSPRQPGGPHCRPVRKSLGMDDAHTMGIRLKQTNRLSRGYAWRWFESRRIRRSRGTIVEHLPLLCPEPDGGPKVGNASSLAILRCTLLPPFPRWLVQRLPDRLAPPRSLPRASLAPFPARRPVWCRHLRATREGGRPSVEREYQASAQTQDRLSSRSHDVPRP